MNKFKIVLLSVIFSLCLAGCKKSNLNDNIPAQNAVSVEITKKNHSWFYFSSNSFHQTDKPQNTPAQALKPWTETIRISSANNSAEAGDNISAFAIVNRLGVLKLDGDEISLSPDVTLFTDRTAGNLVFMGNIPLFSVYKSSFFNDSIVDPNYKNDDSAHLFLVQFDSTAKISYPLINSNNLTNKKNSEVTDFYWNGREWCCSIKTISDTKNEFSYVQFRPQIPLLAISPATASESIFVEESNVDFFRECKKQLAYKDAPERIKKLLSGFDTKLPFEITVKNAGGFSPRVYTNEVTGSKEKALQATAILSQSWSAALFEDGTLFLEGALPGRHILRSGMPVAIRLPKLPTGFVYSDFVISGTTLYAAWEETAFYKTGRAGFLQVNLDRTLYSRLI